MFLTFCVVNHRLHLKKFRWAIASVALAGSICVSAVLSEATTTCTVAKRMVCQKSSNVPLQTCPNLFFNKLSNTVLL